MVNVTLLCLTSENQELILCTLSLVYVTNSDDEEMTLSLIQTQV